MNLIPSDMIDNLFQLSNQLESNFNLNSNINIEQLIWKEKEKENGREENQKEKEKEKEKEKKNNKNKRAMASARIMVVWIVIISQAVSISIIHLTKNWQELNINEIANMMIGTVTEILILMQEIYGVIIVVVAGIGIELVLINGAHGGLNNINHCCFVPNAFNMNGNTYGGIGGINVGIAPCNHEYTDYSSSIDYNNINHHVGNSNIGVDIMMGVNGKSVNINNRQGLEKYIFRDSLDILSCDEFNIVKNEIIKNVNVNDNKIGNNSCCIITTKIDGKLLNKLKINRGIDSVINRIQLCHISATYM